MVILKEKLPTCMRRYDYHLLALDRASKTAPEQHESFINDYNAINVSAAEDDDDDDAEPVEDDDEALLENDDTEELFVEIAEQEALARTVQPLPHAMGRLFVGAAANGRPMLSLLTGASVALLLIQPGL